MISTSQTYNTLVGRADHIFEAKIVINNVTYDKTKIIEISTSVDTMSDAPCVGRAVGTEINATILNPTATVPKMATMELYVRAAAGNTTSEWIPQGTFFVDTRKVSQNAAGIEVLTIHGFDAMLKAEGDFPSTEHTWPARDTTVLADIAAAIGVTVDSRTTAALTAAYRFGLPAGYTMRETLEHIAAAYGGNFVISMENKLLFVPLYGTDPEEGGYYLAVENGYAVTDGSWYIIV